ncbi:MAG: pyridoxamine 5'-phosphate oxidase family protein [Erysipelotrichaceae bacterium]|nr:pyridoxamine 5'-phosphate oxidase family protein [Erysipelotrichaceae bacterium]
MRRKDREVTDFNTIINIINQCDIIRLGLTDDDYPYIVPVNFAYTVKNNQICFYIHGAMAGRKYELMNKNKKCSFEMDIPLLMELIPDKKDITMRYLSVMGTATIEFIKESQKQQVMEDIILNRYDSTRNFDYNKNALPRTMIAKLIVIDITAKMNPISGNAD